MIVSDLIDGRVTLAGLKPETLEMLRYLSNVHNQMTNNSWGVPTAFEALNRFLENVHSDAERRFYLNTFCAFHDTWDVSSSELLKLIANNFCMLLKDSNILPEIFYSGEEIIQFLTHNSIDENQAEALYSYIWSSDAIVSEDGKQTFKEIFEYFKSLPDTSYSEVFLDTFKMICFKEVPRSESDNNSFNVDEYFDFSHGDLEYNREGGACTF
ncbi:hypothetical protein [Cysteiniphilum sp. 6C5]|uniref:hypothetical protein n=1 Tax=unclassified Cysteiniphilum TaxID=2610889 RepID=UPI003F82A4BA